MTPSFISQPQFRTGSPWRAYFHLPCPQRLLATKHFLSKHLLLIPRLTTVSPDFGVQKLSPALASESDPEFGWAGAGGEAPGPQSTAEEQDSGLSVESDPGGVGLLPLRSPGTGSPSGAPPHAC